MHAGLIFFGTVTLQMHNVDVRCCLVNLEQTYWTWILEFRAWSLNDKQIKEFGVKRIHAEN